LDVLRSKGWFIYLIGYFAGIHAVVTVFHGCRKGNTVYFPLFIGTIQNFLRLMGHEPVSVTNGAYFHGLLLCVTVAVGFDSQPHAAPFDHYCVVKTESWLNRAPELQVSQALVVLFPFYGEFGLLVFGKFYHETWSPYV
jgi:hypothetical protein|tara:strand:+ start:550 stop:966 length:417 start_codon:yes stop_codon:yes gene_type:complete